jgi:hypothetical protein
VDKRFAFFAKQSQFPAFLLQKPRFAEKTKPIQSQSKPNLGNVGNMGDMEISVNQRNQRLKLMTKCTVQKIADKRAQIRIMALKTNYRRYDDV